VIGAMRHASRPSVSYAYDAAGRRTSMAVSGQTGVTYAFDNANRMTQISQGSANVSFGYENGGRQASSPQDPGPRRFWHFTLEGEIIVFERLTWLSANKSTGRSVL
jgi:YD repeat-containing protein